MRVVLLAVLLLAGCAAQPEVRVTLYQTRSDTPVDKMEIQVRNEGDEPLTVERAQLESTRLQVAPAWEEPVTIPAGAALDLKVDLTEATCTGDARDEVVLTIEGRTHTYPAEDVLGQMASYRDKQCFRQDVERLATLRIVGVRDDALLVQAEGGVTIGEVGTTVLFRPADPGALVSGRPVRLRPNRCDAHALAEDKQGTFFPVAVTLPDGRRGQYVLGVDQAMRGQLYRLYARLCGLQ